MHRSLNFEIPKSQILNINTYKSLHWAVKGKLTEYLRTLAINEGILHHETQNVLLVNDRLEWLQKLSEQKVKKAQRTKVLKKQGLTAKEVKAQVDEEFAKAIIPEPEVHPESLFDKYSLRVVVFSPTRRRLDPINLYPTVKAIVDGLTDAAWWPDDDYNHMKEISFTYGGLAKSSDLFEVLLEITDVEAAE